MTRFPLPASLAPILVLLALGCGPEQASLSPGERDRVTTEARAAGQALLSALNSHDPDAILAHYDLGEDFTYVACTNVMSGGRGMEPLLRALHGAYKADSYEMDVTRVQVLAPGAAVVFFQGSFRVPLFVSRVFRKGDDGRWRVTWEHESWPGCSGPTEAHPGADPSDAANMGNPTDSTRT
jgi:ketosteroid isomerase-like protein